MTNSRTHCPEAILFMIRAHTLPGPRHCCPFLLLIYLGQTILKPFTMFDDSEYIDYSQCSPSESPSANNENEDFEPHWFTVTAITGAEPHNQSEWICSSSGSSDSSHISNYSIGRLNVPDSEPDRRQFVSHHNTTPRSLDNCSVWVADLLGTSGIYAPLASQSFDDKIPVENKNTISGDLWQRKVSESSQARAQDNDDFEYVLYINYRIAKLNENFPLVPTSNPRRNERAGRRRMTRIDKPVHQLSSLSPSDHSRATFHNATRRRCWTPLPPERN